MINKRSWSRRIVTTTLAVATALTGLTLVTAPAAHADGCKAKVVCGRVANETSSTMRIAVLTDKGKARCKVVDWRTGNLIKDSKGRGRGGDGKTACSWKTLKSGSRSPWVGYDVDAFTFPSRKFWFNGTEYRAGTYVKFKTGLTVLCRNFHIPHVVDTMPRCWTTVL